MESHGLRTARKRNIDLRYKHGGVCELIRECDQDREWLADRMVVLSERSADEGLPLEDRLAAHERFEDLLGRFDELGDERARLIAERDRIAAELDDLLRRFPVLVKVDEELAQEAERKARAIAVRERQAHGIDALLSHLAGLEPETLAADLRSRIVRPQGSRTPRRRRRTAGGTSRRGPPSSSEDDGSPLAWSTGVQGALALFDAVLVRWFEILSPREFVEVFDLLVARLERERPRVERMRQRLGL